MDFLGGRLTAFIHLLICSCTHISPSIDDNKFRLVVKETGRDLEASVGVRVREGDYIYICVCMRERERVSE